MDIETKPLSKRVARMKEEMLSLSPRVDTQRIKVTLEVYEKTKGQPPVILRAKVFEKLCLEKSIFIDDNPIVGNLTSYKYGGYLRPEISCGWMARMEAFSLPLGRAPITAEDKKWIHKAIEHWKGADVYSRTRNIMLQSDDIDISLIGKSGLATEITPGANMALAADFALVLNKGLKGIIAEIEEEKSKLDIGHFESLDKWHFYNAALICLNAVIKLAQRYASLAKEMHQKETDPERKQELERIAETLGQVPANPARNLYEALQAAWFTHLALWIENPSISATPPLRFTQYMYPFYQEDKRKGRITDEEAIELLQLYFLRLQGLTQVYPPLGYKYSSSRVAMNLTLGGLTPNGEDATNELDWLVLEAQQRLQIPEPLINVFYHNKLSEDFLLKCVDLIRTGIGQPAFFNTDVSVQRNLYYHGQQGMTVEEARDNSVVACVQNVIPGYSDVHWEGAINTAKFLELALNNGKDPLTGLQIGLEVGEIDSFQSYQDVYQAVLKQLRHFVPLLRKASRVAWTVIRNFPQPVASTLVHDCIKKGKDLVDGGARYSEGSGYTFIGVVDLANSLAAIEQLVFKDKKVTLVELKKALDANFEGYEDIHRMCLNAPKYGNGDKYPDSLVKELYEICWQEHQRTPYDHLGRPIKPEAYSVTVHSDRGELTGALPNGRKARIALTDASVSAQPGTDKNGPTALVQSAATVIDTVRYGANHFNMKFHPTALAGADGARKFLAMIKTYMDLGGYHVQFNCVSGETLKDAQLHPENYRDLVVRVAGFSAFFITLDKTVQDEVIRRTELKFA